MHPHPKAEMKMKCMSCGIEKDPLVHETSLTAEEDGIVSSPICPLLVIECQGKNGWRAAIVCHPCFHRLEVDMWISEGCWKSLSPQIPYEELPQPVPDDDGDARDKWDPRNYA